MTAPDPKLSRPDTVDPARSRRWLLGTTAAAASLTGLGVAWWHTQPNQDGLLASQPVDDGFWSLQWDTPQGGVLSMQSFQGSPLLVNFWATWCPPCIDELPLINDFYRQNRNSGWQVLGLAVDKLAPVQAFLRQTTLDFPVGMAGALGPELGRRLGNLAGGLPFSVVFGRSGTVLQRKMGRLTADDLALWLGLK